MNEKELYNYSEKIRKELITKGYPVGEINKYSLFKSSKAYGMCKKQAGCFGKVNTFEIKFNNIMLKINKKECLETIIHEFIHTFPNCYNHSKYFHFYANKLNKEFGTNIGTYCSKEVSKKMKNFISARHIVVCLKCGAEIKYVKRNRLIESTYLKKPNIYRHNECRGDIFWLVKYNNVDVASKLLISKNKSLKDIPKNLQKKYLHLEDT